MRLNKVKNIKTAYRISVDSRQNNFILFHCPLDGEPSISEIESFLNIEHGPTIGSMYEGLTKEILEKSMFTNLDLRVVSGKITNSKGHFSRQIDCMLAIGEGDRIPYTNEFVYDFSKVIAVIEVKKNLFNSELESAYENLLSVNKISYVNDKHKISTDQFSQTFENVTKRPFPLPNEVENLNEKDEYIYQALLMESFFPARIIFGYEGYTSEYSLRKGFIDFFKKKIEKNPKGGGFNSLPSLIICNTNSLVKTNGLPYFLADKKNDEWIVYASYGTDPLLLFLEIIWTRISLIKNIDIRPLLDNINTEEALNPLLTGICTKNGWDYQIFEINKKILKTLPKTTNWEPVVISSLEYSIISILCKERFIFTRDERLLKNVDYTGEDLGEALKHLNEERLISIKSGKIKLLTKNIQCAFLPDGRSIAGENKNGRFTEWVNEYLKEKNSK